MHRFFISPADIVRGDDGEPISLFIRDEEAWHLARVLRLTVGTEIIVADGSGLEYSGVLTAVADKAAQARVTAVRNGQAETARPLKLFQGIPKGDKMDWVVQKCTELGVAAIYPVETERVVVRLSADKARERVARWQRIAKEAAKQAGRAVYPLIAPVAPVTDAVTSANVQHLLVPWEEAQRPLAQALAAITASGATADENAIGIVIGPEGGLAASEVDELMAAGGQPVSLGPRIFRTETAGLVALTAALYALGELGGK